MKPSHRRAAFLAAVAVTTAAFPTASAVASAPRSEPARPLTILLSNDDGYGAPGIKAVFDKLTAAGHDVTIVAPATNQSGASVKRTIDEGAQLTAKKVADKVWSVDGTPADSVMFGLGHVLAGQKVDLVVSGTNFGQNIGSIVNNSGTVGAAVTAIEFGMPAIAVSTEIDFENPRNTIANMPATGDFVARLVAQLQRTARGGPLLPKYAGLNVNYPTRPGLASPTGITLTQQTREALFSVAYKSNGGDSYTLEAAFNETEGEAKSDLAALIQGKVSITPIDADWTAAPVTYATTAARLAGLR
ncbi:5'/3'-nucleotidase SurE [Streptosporangium sp. CA-115845]|uniref:5'/3'-nucleotidase SurE n=1 Tax=Streptosporangium sp. CA-115845 TaxID=3240071 RepID=UPI003D94A193